MIIQLRNRYQIIYIASIRYSAKGPEQASPRCTESWSAGATRGHVLRVNKFGSLNRIALEHEIVYSDLLLNS